MPYHQLTQDSGGDAKQKAPVLFTFVPDGRGLVDKQAYKLFNWLYRKHREEIYKATQESLRHQVLYGHALQFQWVDGEFAVIPCTACEVFHAR